MPDYPNPYDFVPLENANPVRRAWSSAQDGLERWHPKRFTGRLHCVLHPVTPLYIHDEGQQGQPKGQVRRFSRWNQQPVIMAGALKGAIRSIYEIVSDSCLSTLSEKYSVTRDRIWTPDPLSIPDAYRPCVSIKHVCPACLLFGMVERRQDDTAGAASEGTPLAGRLSISHGIPSETTGAISKPLSIPAAGGGPHPWHTPFYFGRGEQEQILGRKLYFHHQDYQRTLTLYGDGGKPGLMNIEVQCGDFTFHVDFLNLTQEELACLVYSLALEDNTRHHLGYGKPYGLGTVQITVRRMEMWQAPNHSGTDRFLSFIPVPLNDAPPKAFQRRGLEDWLTRTNARRTYRAFARILTWPGASLYKYPSYGFFRYTSGGGAMTLAEYQRNAG